MLGLIKKLFKKDIPIETTGIYTEYIYTKEDKEYTITAQEILSKGQKELDQLDQEELMFKKHYQDKRSEIENRIASEIINVRNQNGTWQDELIIVILVYIVKI